MSRTGFALAVLALLGFVAVIAFITLSPGDDLPLRSAGDGGGRARGTAERPTQPLPARPAKPAPADPGPAPIRPVPPDTPGALTGRVLTPDGAPVEKAEVYVAAATDLAVVRADLVAWTQTGKDGTFALTSPPGVRDLLVLAPGFLPAVREGVEIAAGTRRSLGDIRLEAGLAVSGRVVFAEGGPVEDALVAAATDDALLSPALVPGRLGVAAWGGSARTDAAGDFRITGLPRGRVRLRAGGRPDIVMEGDPPEVATGTTGHRIVVRRIRVATGRAVDEEGGAVPGATTTLEVTVPEGGGSLIMTTDVEGRFAFDLSDARFSDERVRFAVHVAAEGFEDASLGDLRLADLLPDAKLEVRLVRAAPQEPGKLRGVARYEDGRPFRGTFTLSFSREGKPGQVFRAEADEQGAFLIEGIIPGEYVLRTAAHSSRILRETGTRLVIPPGGEETAEFTFIRGGDVQLTVRGPDGTTPAGATATLLSPEGEEAGAWPVPAAGIVIPDLTPGEVRLRVSAPGFQDREVTATVEKDQATPVAVTLEESR